MKLAIQESLIEEAALYDESLKNKTLLLEENYRTNIQTVIQNNEPMNDAIKSGLDLMAESTDLGWVKIVDITETKVGEVGSLISKLKDYFTSINNLGDAIDSLNPKNGTPIYTGKIQRYSIGGDIPRFKTGGQVIGDGLVFAEDKEILLNNKDSDTFREFVSQLRISKVPTLSSLNLSGIQEALNKPLPESNTSGETIVNNYIDKLEFPNIVSAEGIKNAVQNLPNRVSQYVHANKWQPRGV